MAKTRRSIFGENTSQNEIQSALMVKDLTGGEQEDETISREKENEEDNDKDIGLSNSS